MNRYQRRILALFAAVTAVMICFPPWRTVFIGGSLAPEEWSEGYAFFLTPPSPKANAYQYHAELHVGIDWPLLGSVWGTTIILFACLCRTFRLPSDEHSLDQILARSKLQISFLVALCFPVFPVAILVPYLFFEGGHLWESALLLESVVLVGFLILTYSAMSVTQFLLRKRSDHETGLQSQP
jgi:hypothetical protein